jgi:hypothetical protein
MTPTPASRRFDDWKQPYSADDLVAALLNAKADPNARNNRGETPLHIADTVSEIKALAQAGADAKLKDVDGKTALTVRKSEVTVATYMVKAAQNSLEEALARYQAAVDAKDTAEAAKWQVEVNSRDADLKVRQGKLKYFQDLYTALGDMSHLPLDSSRF